MNGVDYCFGRPFIFLFSSYNWQTSWSSYLLYLKWYELAFRVSAHWLLMILHPFIHSINCVIGLLTSSYKSITDIIIADIFDLFCGFTKVSLSFDTRLRGLNQRQILLFDLIRNIFFRHCLHLFSWERSAVLRSV